MPRIVIIADCIDTQQAGIHVYTRNLIDSLSCSNKFEIIPVRLGFNKEITFNNQIIVKPVIPFLIKDPFRLFFTLPHIIKKLNPDIVIEPAHFGPFNLPAKIKRVTIIHDLTPILFPKWHSFISSKLQQLFLPRILKKASLIISNSDNTKKDILKQYPFTSGKTVRIYPSVDPFFRMDQEELIDQKRPFILSVGTFEPRKNLTVLLEAFQLFREQTKYNFSLVICGYKGWKNRQFYNHLEKHPFVQDIQIKGFVEREELKELYSTTSAFIYPSLYEGFGFPVAEAMGCGAPCIVSERSSLPEVGGPDIYYFNPESAQQLCDRMKAIASQTDSVSNNIIGNWQRSQIFSPQSFTEDLENALAHLK